MEVIDYPKYKIFPDGRLWSDIKKKFLTPRVHTNGYHRYQLLGRDFYVHRLVATHYIPNPENLIDVDHIDLDRTNNNVENLRWASRRQNMHNATNNREDINIRVRPWGAWEVSIMYQRKVIYNPTFKTREEAIIARDNFYVNNPQIK